MKSKKYSIMLVMSLLIMSINQLLALQQMSQQDHEQVEFQSESIESEFLPYSTEAYVYTIDRKNLSAEPGIVSKPVIISDVIANNYLNSGKIRTLITQETKNGLIITTTETWKTKNPSYLTWSNGALAVGAVGAVAFAYMALNAYRANLARDMEDYLKKEEVLLEQGLEFSRLTSDKKRATYLKDAFKNSKISDDVSFDVLAHYMHGASPEMYADFFDKINELAQKNKTNVLTMDIVDQAFVHVNMHSLSDQIGQSLFPAATKKELKDISSLVENLEGVSNWLNPQQKKVYAYHEAGHALMTSLKNKNTVLSQFSLKPQGFLGGAIMTVPLSKESDNSVAVISQKHDEKIAEARNEIMMLVSGGIGHELLDGKKLSYEDFLVQYGGEIGNAQKTGTDMNQAAQKAIYHAKIKDFSLVSVYQEDIEPYAMPTQEELDKQSAAFIEECYHDAYELLSAHKGTLDKIVEGPLREGVTSGDKIYNMVDVQRPKYDFELTPTEKTFDSFTKWLSWTSKRMNFYDRNSPQF